jgi:signal transduction histidine kinase
MRAFYREPREAARVRDDDLPHIFERFHRGHLASRAGTPGTGLGLAIAGAIVEGHGGRLRANNQPGGGARIIVRLPVAASSATAAPGTHRATRPEYPGRR